MVIADMALNLKKFTLTIISFISKSIMNIHRIFNKILVFFFYLKEPSKKYNHKHNINYIRQKVYQ